MPALNSVTLPDGNTYDFEDSTKLTFNDIYPIGSIYMSVNSADPGTLFTGTVWEAWGNGKVPVGIDVNDTDFDTVEETGGAKTQNYKPTGTVSKPTFSGTAASLTHTGGKVGSHTLTISEMPSHSHAQRVTANSGTAAIRKDYSADAKSQIYDQGCNTGNTGGGGGHDHPFTQPTAHSYTPAGSVSQPTFTGTSATLSHLQPYITCYMWKRVS